MSSKNKKLSIKKIILRIIIVILAIILVIAALLFFYPVSDKALTNPEKSPIESYEKAMAKIKQTIAWEKSQSDIKPDCGSKIHSHGKKTKQTIVIFQGYTSCTGQYDDVAKYFFDAGFNVYIPRKPHHGTTQDSNIYSNMTARKLVNFANQAIDISVGLGETTNVMGLSGGANLATWAAIYRDDVAKKTLLLSPFYQPSEKEMPRYIKRPMEILYGFKLVPDDFHGEGDDRMSYYGMAQYLIIADNFPKNPKPKNLKAIGMIISEQDEEISKVQAEKIYQSFEENPNLKKWLHYIPAEWGTKHDIMAGKDNDDLNGKKDVLFPMYLKFFKD